jgi:hypothetical protein
MNIELLKILKHFFIRGIFHEGSRGTNKVYPLDPPHEICACLLGQKRGACRFALPVLGSPFQAPRPVKSGLRNLDRWKARTDANV